MIFWVTLMPFYIESLQEIRDDHMLLHITYEDKWVDRIEFYIAEIISLWYLDNIPPITKTLSSSRTVQAPFSVAFGVGILSATVFVIRSIASE